MAAEQSRQLAVVTGASSGIGYELARVFAEEGFDQAVYIPGSVKAEKHREMAEPGSAEEGGRR